MTINEYIASGGVIISDEIARQYNFLGVYGADIVNDLIHYGFGNRVLYNSAIVTDYVSAIIRANAYKWGKLYGVMERAYDPAQTDDYTINETDNGTDTKLTQNANNGEYAYKTTSTISDTSAVTSSSTKTQTIDPTIVTAEQTDDNSLSTTTTEKNAEGVSPGSTQTTSRKTAAFDSAELVESENDVVNVSETYGKTTTVNQGGKVGATKQTTTHGDEITTLENSDNKTSSHSVSDSQSVNLSESRTNSNTKRHTVTGYRGIKWAEVLDGEVRLAAIDLYNDIAAAIINAISTCTIVI